MVRIVTECCQKRAYDRINYHRARNKVCQKHCQQNITKYAVTKLPLVSFMIAPHIPSTKDVRRNPAATINMVAIKSVFTFEKPDKAPAASIQPVKYNAVREIIAVSHIGILFSM